MRHGRRASIWLTVAVLLSLAARPAGAPPAPAATAPKADAAAIARVVARITADSIAVDRLMNRGARDSTHALLASLIAEARATGDPATIARALLLDGAQDCRLGLGAEALPRVLEGRRFAEASGDTGVQMWETRVERMARGYGGAPCGGVSLRNHVRAVGGRSRC